MDHYLQQPNSIMQNITIAEITHDRALSLDEADDMKCFCTTFNALPDQLSEQQQ